MYTTHPSYFIQLKLWNLEMSDSLVSLAHLQEVVEKMNVTSKNKTKETENNELSIPLTYKMYHSKNLSKVQVFPEFSKEFGKKNQIPGAFRNSKFPKQSVHNGLFCQFAIPSFSGKFIGNINISP